MELQEKEYGASGIYSETEETPPAPTVASQAEETPPAPTVEYVMYIKRPRTPAQLEALRKARLARTHKREARRQPVANIEPLPLPPQRTFMYVV